MCLLYNEPMPTPILAAKLYVPPLRPQGVLRPRLIERLNEGLSRKLTLISAPAGFGKTTLVSAWVAGCARPAAWLSLDEADSDPARFLTYLVSALQTVEARVGKDLLGMLHAPQSPTALTEALLTELLNEIATIPKAFVLILDDYHVLDSQAIDQALNFLIEHQPPQMHLVIATREDPPLPLARLRGRGHLTELRADDLRFTSAEAADFLNAGMGLALREADIAALAARTEGWIAGLQLAALSMQGRSDAASFIRAFAGSHRFVLDYLLEEVLQKQPERVQSFLLRTSILDRLCGALCDAVLDTPAAAGQETLEYLERANLFIVPLDNVRGWYRYHHLFGDLLRQRLGHPPTLAGDHRRASVWYEARDNLTEALRHAVAAGDFERAARLAEAAWKDMERTFQTAAWLGWAKKLPHAVIGSRPRLCVQIGWAFSDIGDTESSEAYLQGAERALAGAPAPDALKSLPATIALIRADNAQIQGNLADTMKYAELSVQLAPDDEGLLRAQAAITLGFTHWAAGNLEASLRATRAWMDDMRRLGNQNFVIVSAFAVADMLIVLGRLGEAEKGLRQAIQQAAAQGQEAIAVTAHHHLALALLAHERGDAAAAGRRLQSAADLGQRTTLVDWLYRWNLAQARLKESAGEWDAALDLLDEASRVYVKNAIPLARPVEALKARLYLKQGRPDQAAAWARERGLSVTDAVSYLGECEYLTLARLRLAEGAFAGVTPLLERLLALAEAQRRTGNMIEIRLTQALAHQAQGSRPPALAALERALALAEPEGYLRAFVDEGEPLRLLLLDFRAAHEKQPAHPLLGYVSRILAAFSPPGAAASATPMSQDVAIIEPLTDRELEVLRLVAAGYSNVEISRRLYLAVSTVKGHNLRIFSKLQVQNRTEAVARARELGLL